MVSLEHGWKKYALALGLTLIMAACSGSSSKKEAHQNSTTSTKTPSDSKPISQSTTGLLQKSDFEITLCKLYQAKFFEAVSHHLTAKISDYEKLIQKGLASWIVDKQIEEPRAVTKINELKITNYCDAFIGVTKLMFEFGPVDQKDQNVPYLEYARQNVNALLRTSLNKLDHYSTVYSLNTTPLVTPTDRATPIPLLYRADYIWRIPTALVVDPSYNGQIHEEITKWSLITDLSGFDINQSSFRMSQAYLQKGVSGDKLSLTFIRPDDAQEQEIEIDTIETQTEDKNSVQSHIINDEILYLRISEISEKSKDIILSHLPSPLTEIKNYRGLILDLTGNGGGRADYSEKIASLFLPYKSPLIRSEYYVSTTQSAKELKTELRYHQYPNLENIPVEDLPPVIILVSRKSASAAELITAILRSNQLPVLIVGEYTFGKAIGQTYKQAHPLLDFWGYTDKAFYAFDIQDDGEVKWESWQLDEKKGRRGIKPHVEIIDPVIEHLSKNSDAVDFDEAFTMADHKKSKDIPVIEFSHPQSTMDEPVHILIPEEYRLKKEEVMALQEHAKTLRITSCDSDAIPGNPKFSEARECLYESGVAIMNAWIELRENS